MTLKELKEIINNLDLPDDTIVKAIWDGTTHDLYEYSIFLDEDEDGELLIDVDT